MATSLDHELGLKIGSLLQQPTFKGRVDSRLISQVQDLLGSETSLLAPLRDMLLRPGFQSVVQTGLASARITGRDALIGDLQQTYNAAVCQRLEDVLNGILNLPRAAAGKQQPHPEPPQTQRGYTSQNSQTGAAPNTSSHTVHTYSVQTAPPSQGILTGAVIALLSLLFGGGVVGLGWVLLSQSQTNKQIQENAGGGGGGPTPTFPSMPEAKPPEAPKAPGDSNLWGRPEDYKFGQTPNSQYPHTCAFSITDARGEQTLADKSKLEFWSCRDEGGNPSNGYAVTWGDGKRTVYQFNQNGVGSVVGTNGQSVAIRWQNSRHNEQPIIVISHQDGATSWIPGNVGA